MKKFMSLALALMLALSLTACGSKEAETTAAPETTAAVETTTAAPETTAAEEPSREEVGNMVLLMATTTSTDNTGLLDYLAPLFFSDTGYELIWTAVGTGEALAMGQNGDVDIVLVHSKASEIEFVEGGYGVERFPVMYNDYVIVGPTAPIEKNDDVLATFTKIHEDGLAFVSRGDDSGTHKKEVKIWGALELDPAANEAYVESGQGMGATITMADEQQAYCLTDRGTWLKQVNDATLGIELEIICEGSSDLLNQYGVIAVNPEMYPEVNNEAANAFIEWICSEPVQELIAEFGVEEYGQPLFFPNAGEDA